MFVEIALGKGRPPLDGPRANLVHQDRPRSSPQGRRPERRTGNQPHGRRAAKDYGTRVFGAPVAAWRSRPCTSAIRENRPLRESRWPGVRDDAEEEPRPSCEAASTPQSPGSQAAGYGRHGEVEHHEWHIAAGQPGLGEIRESRALRMHSPDQNTDPRPSSGHAIPSGRTNGPNTSKRPTGTGQPATKRTDGRRPPMAQRCGSSPSSSAYEVSAASQVMLSRRMPAGTCQ